MSAAYASQQCIETIIRLAEEIGRSAPECAGKAVQIAELARGLADHPDESVIRDALEAQVLTDEFSDVSTRNAARAVAGALKE